MAGFQVTTEEILLETGSSLLGHPNGTTKVSYDKVEPPKGFSSSLQL
jgi:hypothetical protein